MVDPIADLKTLKQEMSTWVDELPRREDIARSVTILEYIISQLSGPRCPECGRPMTFNQELQADVCSHADESD